MSYDSQPLVSIIVPLYNQERYLGACLRSVCRQTYKNLEIIIVNDGSTDRSLQIVHDWASRDERLIIVNKQNEGLSYARRDGLLAATGDFVSFLDSDDLMTHRSIELMMNAVKNYGVDLVIGMYDNLVGCIATHHKADKYCLFPCERVVSQPELFDKYYVNFFGSTRMFPINAWGKLYRKSVLDKACRETELFSPNIPFTGEDLYFNMKVFPYLDSAYRIDASVYKYRYGGGTFGFNTKFPQIFFLFDKRLELLDKCNYTQGYAPLFEQYEAFLYHHASQLIFFKKSNKQDVISFLRQEFENRNILHRIKEFFAQKDNLSEGDRLLLNMDYEGMYKYCEAQSQTIFGSLKYKMISLLVKAFS